MVETRLSRRDSMTLLTAAGVGEALATGCKKRPAQQAAEADPRVGADRIRRMKWWHEAKFGRFILWGPHLFASLGRWCGAHGGWLL